MTMIEVGRLLRTNVSGCVVGCWVSRISVPRFGGLVCVRVEENYSIFGLVHDIRVEDDGLARQLLSAESLDEDVIQDNRFNRNVPVEISVLFVGYEDHHITHLLPPRPPLILNAMFSCTQEQISQFTSVGRFGYFRHILRTDNIPTGELLAAHLQQADHAHKQAGRVEWGQKAVQELIILLRDDYDRLMELLGALSDTGISLSDIAEVPV